ncbi:MAG: GAF domain-containing protein [Actinomycetaceae bacterium]|nr:GAF domain-containing protein [Arcanobacterium sp.]MDD7686865.1 GAF domain-containing protein [Actinomycetaceae bacterium]MDY5274044.1 GAF domain-containing protein [Arcanobacterium sp.]
MTNKDSTFRKLFELTVVLTSKLDRVDALTFLTQAARDLSRAAQSGVGILDSRGSIIEFATCGLTPEQKDHLPIPLARDSVFPNVSATSVNVMNSVPEDAFAEVLPSSLLPVRNFMGLPVLVHGQVWGRIFVANKPEDFTEADVSNMRLLAQAAAVAVHNTRLYAQAQSRSRWLTASQNIVSSLLEGNEEEDALQVITDEMLTAGRADIALMVLPSINDAWACEFVAGVGAKEYLGLTFPPEGRARTVIREQAGIIVDSMQRMAHVRVPVLRRFGPSLYAPLISNSGGRGVIVLLRYPNSPEFDLNDLAMAENVAQQATIALELAEARKTKEQAAELDERSRISRDLHDLAIQQLFASGMHITAVREELAASNPPAAVTEALDKALGAIDDSVGQIRRIVQSLRDEGSSQALVDRLRHETKMALQSLGFAPSLLITFNGATVAAESDFMLIDDAVGADISDDVVAVVREGLSNAARHAHASSVAITITVTLDAIEVLVVDDGAGIAPSLSRRSGLSNLAARARRHRGTFSLKKRADGHSGAQMTWRAPLR